MITATHASKLAHEYVRGMYFSDLEREITEIAKSGRMSYEIDIAKCGFVYPQHVGVLKNLLIDAGYKVKIYTNIVGIKRKFFKREYEYKTFMKVSWYDDSNI